MTLSGKHEAKQPHDWQGWIVGIVIGAAIACTAVWSFLHRGAW